MQQDNGPDEPTDGSGEALPRVGAKPTQVAGVDIGGMFSVTVSKKDAEIDRLSNQLSDESDKRKEERFGWICAILALVNYLLLKDVANFVTPLVVVAFELIALLILARRSGLEYIELIISRLIGSVTGKIGK